MNIIQGQVRTYNIEAHNIERGIKECSTIEFWSIPCVKNDFGAYCNKKMAL